MLAYLDPSFCSAREFEPVSLPPLFRSAPPLMLLNCQNRISSRTIAFENHRVVLPYLPVDFATAISETQGEEESAVPLRPQFLLQDNGLKSHFAQTAAVR